MLASSRVPAISLAPSRAQRLFRLKKDCLKTCDKLFEIIPSTRRGQQYGEQGKGSAKKPPSQVKLPSRENKN